MIISIGLPPNLPLSEYARLARVVEDYDFEAIYVDDRPHSKSCWPLLHTIARSTSRVKLGTSVTHPFFRHPLVTASEVAVLDEVSGNRTVLGIGRGDREYYSMVGLRTYMEMEAVKEAVELIRRLLSGRGEAYRGKVFSAREGLTLQFKPPRSHVPIYIGTVGPKMFQVAGEVADGVQSAGLSSTSYVPVAIENVRIGARRAGRDPKEVRIGADIWTCISHDREEAEGMLKPILANRIPKLKTMVEALGLDPEEVDKLEVYLDRAESDRAASLVSRRSIDALTICGTPEDAIRRIKELGKAGVQHITLKKPLGPDLERAIRIIGEEVIPRIG